LAREFGVSRNAVRRALRAEDRGAPATRAERPSKLDPYRAKIKNLVIDQDLSVVRVQEEIAALGYTGGASILKEYVRTLRPARRPQPTIRMETSPGDLAQMDWSPYSLRLGVEETVVHAFSLVLAWSRYAFVRFVTQTDLVTIERLHVEALEHIVGVPARISYDNMTTVGCHRGPGEIWLNPSFERLARHYGYSIEILPPGRPQLHGTVERFFGHLEGNFLAGRTFVSLEDLNRKLVGWLERANARVHGTTRERPVDRLRAERAYLRPLPGQRAETAQVLERKVQTDFSVTVGTNRYSVPPRFVGRYATVKLYDKQLEVVIDTEVVARHARLEGSYERSLLPEHEAAFHHLSPQRELLKVAFLRLGPMAEDYYEGLRRGRGKGAGYHMARILRLADRYGSRTVSGALVHAARFGAYSAEAVARVLAGQAVRVRKRTGANVPSMPDDVRHWLEGQDVEKKPLEEFDSLVEPDPPTEPPDPEKDEE
jgi:transposase